MRAASLTRAFSPRRPRAPENPSSGPAPHTQFWGGRWSLTPTQENCGPPQDASSGYIKASLTLQVDSVQLKRTSFLKRDPSGELNRWALVTPKRILQRSLGASGACRIASGTRSTPHRRSTVGGGRPQVASCPQFSEPPG